jgi:DNA polymerase IV
MCLLAKVKDLFAKLYKKGQKIRLLGVRFSHLIPMTLQMNLFNNETEKMDLFKTIDNIKNEFGTGVIQKATSLPVSGRKKNQ